MKFYSILFVFIWCSCFSQNESDSARYEKARAPYVLEMSRIRKVEKDIRLIKGDFSDENFKKKMDSLDELFGKNYQNLLVSELKFGKENPQSNLSARILNSQITTQYASAYYELFYDVYKNFSEDVLKTNDAKEFIKKFTGLKNTSEGKLIPNFILKDSNGKVFEMEKMQGKIVLVDFWASWCAPCIEDFAELKRIQKHFKDQDFIIVSISVDDNLDSWKKAINKYDLTDFVNLSTKENKSNLRSDFVITGIPVKFLVDRSGIIAKKLRGGGQENLDEVSKLVHELISMHSKNSNEQ